jgi:hypothetical protein
MFADMVDHQKPPGKYDHRAARISDKVFFKIAHAARGPAMNK